MTNNYLLARPYFCARLAYLPILDKFTNEKRKFEQKFADPFIG